MIRVEIETGNAAFAEEPAAEVARLLSLAAVTIAGTFRFVLSPYEFSLLDLNGNTVGRVVIEVDED